MDDIDHRHIIASLSKDDRHFLTAKIDAPGIVRIAAHLGSIAILTALIAIRIDFWQLLLLPQGILLVFLFTTLHETIHETAFKTGWLNQVIATLAGLLIVLPPIWFRYFHFAHHRHTHDPDNDPELASPEPKTIGQYLIYLTGALYWLGMSKIVVTNALGKNSDKFVPEKGRRKIIVEARAFLAVYVILAAASLAAGSTLLLWVWIVPILLGQPFLRAYLLAEHARCPHVANMLENTRTTFTTPLVRFIAWNMPYHAEHHSYPAVPFHKLPHFHKMIAKHLRSTENGYAKFHSKLIEELGDQP